MQRSGHAGGGSATHARACSPLVCALRAEERRRATPAGLRGVDGSRLPRGCGWPALRPRACCAANHAACRRIHAPRPAPPLGPTSSGADDPAMKRDLLRRDREKKDKKWTTNTVRGLVTQTVVSRPGQGRREGRRDPAGPTPAAECAWVRHRQAGCALTSPDALPTGADAPRGEPGPGGGGGRGRRCGGGRQREAASHGPGSPRELRAAGCKLQAACCVPCAVCCVLRALGECRRVALVFFCMTRAPAVCVRRAGGGRAHGCAGWFRRFAADLPVGAREPAIWPLPAAGGARMRARGD